MRLQDLLTHIDYMNFDFNAIVKYEYNKIVELSNRLGNKLAELEYFLVDPKTLTIIFQQRGIIRTNCLDCLDRTNLVQS